MSSDEKLFIGLDTSYEQGLVLVFNQEKVLFIQTLTNKFSHAQNIAEALKNAHDFCLTQNKAIDCVAVGVGPGSFVGIRIALATALGFCMATNIKLVSVCSHLALANSLDTNYSHVCVAMKAAGDLFYVSKFINDILINDIKVLNLDEINQYVSKNFAIISDFSDLFINYSEKSFINGVKASGFLKAFLTKFNNIDLIKDESLVIKPNYIKEVSINKKVT